MSDRCPTCGSVPRTVWTKAAILDACRRWVNEHGTPPCASDWMRSTPKYPAATSALVYFGSWNEMIQVAGFHGRRPGGQPGWTRDSAKAALTPWVYAHGRLPKARDWKNRADDRPAVGQVERLFGSWNAYLVACGYEPERKNRSLRAYSNMARDRDELGRLA